MAIAIAAALHLVTASAPLPLYYCGFKAVAPIGEEEVPSNPLPGTPPAADSGNDAAGAVLLLGGFAVVMASMAWDDCGDSGCQGRLAISLTGAAMAVLGGTMLKPGH
jgi:hypothetical protein